MPETMAGQILPETVVREGLWLRRRSNLTALAVRRILRRRGGLAGLDTAIAPVSLTVKEFQRQAAERSASRTPALMASMGLDLPDADYVAATDEFAGVLGDGTSVIEGVSGVFTGAHTVARTAGVESSELYRQYLETNLLRLARTAVADTYRAVQQVTAHGIYPHVGYIRALTPPSCGRCVLLAGQWSGERPFERHPNCDCIAVPVPLNKDGEMMLDDTTAAVADPETYLNSLSDHDLARTLGSKANAQAYKDGADYIQIVNAYRRKGYVYAASDGSKYTWLNGYESRRHMVEAGMGHYDSRNRPRPDVARMMPETIYRNATSPEEAKRLLYEYGWIRNVWDSTSNTYVRPQL